MAQRVVHRRRLPSGVREIPNRGVAVEKIQSSVEMVINSPAAGQPTPATTMLPPGVYVTGFSYVTEVTWPTTTTTLNLGDDANTTRYYSAKDIDAEGSDYQSVYPPFPYPTGGNITAAVTTTGTAATGGKTRVRLYYR